MLASDRIVRLKTVLARTGLSRSTIYRKIAEGTFPSQMRISVNGAGWRESDINRWIADPAAWGPRGGSASSAARKVDNGGKVEKWSARPAAATSRGARSSRRARYPAL
jgi:prophage regulatory protein